MTPTPQPVDLAAWKQQDYQQLQDYHEWQQAAADADRAFDAEVRIDPKEIPSSIQSPSSEKGDTFWERTVLNREFWVSVAVDTVISVAVGVAAAALVAAGMAFLATADITVAIPLAVAATVIVGIYIGWQIEQLGIPDQIVQWLDG